MANEYGPENPHPLSQMSTELVWEGKYDERGNRREVDIAGCAMPLQKIETVDQPRWDAAAAGQSALFEKKSKREDDCRNMLVWGDNKLVMASLLRDFKGKVDLVYIDPPFDVGADFTMTLRTGDEGDAVGKAQSLMEMVAYRDTWGKGADSYLHVMQERIALLRDLLSETGTILIHCDWRVGHYLRELLDEIFGQDHFLNEIVWIYKRWSTRSTVLPRLHDTIWWYSKDTEYHFELPMVPNIDPNPSQYVSSKDSNGKTVVLRDADGKPVKREVREEIPVPDYWDVPLMSPVSKERVGFPTQKPERLLTRIIQMATSPGDLVADVFCGSGTTGAVAERLGRRWIMCDLGRFAIHTTRKRLIELQRDLNAAGEPYRAFDVYNLGRYERQWWQKEYLDGADEEHRRLVLEFFKAEVFDSGRAPSPLIHGRKNGALCHVDGIDSIFTREEAKAVAKAVREAGGDECYCLAWEFEMDLPLATSALEQELGVHLKLVQIPREIMEKNRKNPPPFPEVAVLKAEPVIRDGGDRKMVDIKLTKFLPSLAEVPSKELEAIKERAARSGFDFIDFWAVDFDWQPGKPFAHHWQDYRTRKDRTLKTVSDAGFTYGEPGTHTACVKVVDTFGCDTSITVEVQV